MFFVEGGEDIVGRQEPLEFVLLAGQVRLGADDACPLGCLHPLVCAPPPLRRGERAEMIVTVGVCRVVPDLASRSLEAAKGFYGDVLALQPAMDHDWIITRPILDGRMSSSA